MQIRSKLLSWANTQSPYLSSAAEPYMSTMFIYNMLRGCLKIPPDLIINLRLDKYGTIEKPTTGNATGPAHGL